jgi:hypothetical protein
LEELLGGCSPSGLIEKNGPKKAAAGSNQFLKANTLVKRVKRLLVDLLRLPLPSRHDSFRATMRTQQLWPVVFQQRLEDLRIGKALVDQGGNLATHAFGHATGIGIATRQRVKVPRAPIPLHLACAVDAREKPLDPIGLRASLIAIGRQRILLDAIRRGRHQQRHAVPRRQIGLVGPRHHEADQGAFAHAGLDRSGRLEGYRGSGPRNGLAGSRVETGEQASDDSEESVA